MKPGDLIADRFEIERLAGSGGMGAVYRARDQQSGAPVAVKVLWGHHMDQPEQGTRFEREAQVLQDLCHPGIVRYIDSGVTGAGEPYLALEWLEGESLLQRLRKQRLSVCESVELGRRIAEALAEAHRAGVVHRDLKPSNLYLVGGAIEGLKVLDFGIAKVAGSAPLTMTGMVVGTPYYMAPEQARGARDVDARADVFALGCVLFHCIAGRPPFAGDEMHSVLLKVVLDDAPRLSSLCDEIPSAVDDLVTRMLAKPRADRPADASAVLAALEGLGLRPAAAGPDATLTSGPGERREATTSSITGRELRVVCAVVVRLDAACSALAANAEARMGEVTVAITPRAVPGEPVAVPATQPLGEPSRPVPTTWPRGESPAVTRREGEDPEVVALASAPAVASLMPAAASDPSDAAEGGRPSARVGSPEEVLLRAAAKHQAKFEPLGDGLFGALIGGGGAATDQAARAARCALAMRAAVPFAPMAVVGGRAAPAARAHAVEVMDRGRARLAAEAQQATETLGGDGSRTEPPIHVDDTVAGLLGGRFDLGGDARGLVLRGERGARGRSPERESARTLLGRSTPYVGREREAALLEAAFEECIGEPASRAVLVTAPAGVGKSRLALEFLRVVEERYAGARVLGAAQIWRAQGDLMSAGSAFGMLAQILRREAGLLDGEPRVVRQQKLRARAARHVPERDVTRVSQFLGEIAQVPFSDKESVELRAARQDPMLMGDQMRRAWEDLLAAECEAHPLVLVLEDLHWGDLPTVTFIDAALRSLHDRPFFVFALARPEAHDLFPKLWAQRGAQEIRLRELGRRGSERLARAALGPSASGEVVARIVERAAGNAFYLEELIRAAADGKSEDLPDSVLAMVEARLESLHPEARRVLRAASVFGQVFFRGALAPLLGGEARFLGDFLRELTERELVVRRGEGKFPGEDEYAFRHALVREAAYAMLTEADRRLGHKLAAEWLERAGERDARVLATHFERGGEPERAAVWYRRAAEQALEGNDFAAAITLAARGAARAPSEVSGALLLLEAEAHKWLGAAAEAERAAACAMTRFPLGSPLWYVAAAEAGSMRLRLGRHEELATLAEEVRAQGLAFAREAQRAVPPAPARLEPPVHLDGPESLVLPGGYQRSSLPPGPPPEGAAVSAVARLAGSLLHDGQYAPAEALISSLDRTAGPIAERDAAVSARLYALHASRALCYGDPLASLQWSELSVPSFSFTGDRRNACMGRVNAAHALVQLGEHARAERALRAVRADAERMGLFIVRALALQNLGLSLARQGALEEARLLAQGAASAFAAQENRRQEGRARIYLAQILALESDLESAEIEARAAAVRLATIRPLRAFALGVLSDVLRRRGHAEAALGAAREGMELLLATGGMEEGEASLRLAYAEALLANENLPAALDAIDVARRRLTARAVCIADPALHQSFCANVPENARTFELARAWLGA
jgi:eukaryotic-like serine/threonine-protein kinase